LIRKRTAAGSMRCQETFDWVTRVSVELPHDAGDCSISLGGPREADLADVAIASEFARCGRTFGMSVRRADQDGRHFRKLWNARADGRRPST
jgi:hypothetical protein